MPILTKCKYPLQQHKHKHKKWLPKCPILQMHPIQEHKHKRKGLLPKCPALHVYIHSTTKQIWTQSIVAKIPICISVYALYNNKKINAETRLQNTPSYMCTYNIRKHLP